MLTHSTLDDIQYSYSKHSHSAQRRRSSKYHRHRRKSSKSSNKYINYTHDKCAVCLDDATCLDTKLFPCGHTFHGQCLIQWVTVQKGRKFNCPLCRQDIAHFIQMTGNQQINQQLIEIWNEHYLYNTAEQQTEINNKTNNIQCIEQDEPLKSKIMDETDIIKPQNIITKVMEVKIVEAIKEENNPDISAVDTKEELHILADENGDNDSNKIKRVGSIWKFLWKSPLSILYQQRNDSFSPFIMSNSGLYSIYDVNMQYDDIDDVDISQDILDSTDKSRMSFNSDPSVPSYSECKQTTKTQIDSTNSEYQQQQQYVSYNDDITESLHNDTEGIYNNNFLAFSLLNFKSGIFAGFSAGTTTYLISGHIKRDLFGKGIAGSFRNTLYPILSDTVPSVAIFFTSYEHLKRYLFNIDNMNDTQYQVFTERFISAGIASYFAYFVSNIGKGQQPLHVGQRLLPFRFASFFGTFELCKDLINKKHEELNMFQVASSAAIGGSISHCLYYGLSQYKNLYIQSIENVPISYHGATRYLYKGCISSLSKFLPSCVVCSCAFEISKRYLNS